MEKLKNIYCQFGTQRNAISIIPFGSGHINDTFKVIGEGKNYLLQRINHEIFKNVDGLTTNIVKVTDFLRLKIKQGSEKQVLNSIITQSGKYYFKDATGNYWRMFDFIENSKSFDFVENAELAYKGGKAYGEFVKLLSDFPANELVDTIPDFHNANFRIKQFKEAVKDDQVGRAKDVKDLIEELDNRSESMKIIQQLGDDGVILKRVTHNDTKINNVLFNDKNEGICVIDLDTVMPGFVHFDFGDAIRTFTNTGNEDEADLSKISMNINLFEGFAKGFLSETKDVLTPEEFKYLAFSAKYIVYEQTIR
ncbi:aminoglycoside phosphotransferase family protein, partial [Desulfosarcina sp.]|nr:aminoglycoside phosphotransferase family protein [Desulfosarcina sp.]